MTDERKFGKPAPGGMVWVYDDKGELEPGPVTVYRQQLREGKNISDEDAKRHIDNLRFKGTTGSE